ncbi:hypothetical protein LEP1GSC103_3985 [Leptospira borgpetersenii serovar Javanica str. UI 09931]|uniref:Uncharacterized protein n=2 Tax=Leptospira borgpetersenii TaxID=174 RepID=A0A0E3B415_LEPBO|nr:hypothetical protein LBBP_00599 [Leptospira borgpetersenii serovar Ballum]EKQ91195.1 hypothetical protein LEP1GSC101_1499 [Leptospira borgpetersenii str. UI 09149]EKR02063.1 hypothetical protein LEP1GSC121_0889 [Leptospira borgpetersenii serovar Castellonis str. 200801910]EMN56307.1 hypothetical protein LEP1GSC090_1980 [Leptospira borgpetersenii serovar Javanica str. MK146]EMO09393.1 hypothetical protein LEP1GSC137_2061 [Leptospira borgpetersenii str. Noumea 25]EPG59585.1 hypothetical prote
MLGWAWSLQKRQIERGMMNLFLKRMLTDWKYIIDFWKRFLDFFGVKSLSQNYPMWELYVFKR